MAALHFTIRSGHDSDADGYIALIDACWSQYPGIVMDVDGEMPELRALASYYADKGGTLWAAEANGRITGMIATIPLGGRVWEVCRVYTLPSTHGTGLGHALLDTAESHARAACAARLVLWSDTRFDRAHRFYEKRGYVRSGSIRALHDISNSLEFEYAKPITGIGLLDAQAALSAERCLAEVLCACVGAGASLPYLQPLELDTARAIWRRVITKVTAGTHILLAGWLNGALVGTVTLELCSAPNRPNLAEVHNLLVHPSARKRGIARALMERLELEASRAGRHLIVLDTRAGGDDEWLYRDMGWQEAAPSLDFVTNTDGKLDATVFYSKAITTAASPRPRRR